MTTPVPVGDGRGRPHVVLVVGPTEPRPLAMCAAAGPGRWVGSEMLVVAPVRLTGARLWHR